MLKLNHKDLIVWKKSIELVKEVYSISVSSNTSEGASKKSKNEWSRFYEITKSSLVEVDTQIKICLTLSFLNEGDIHKLEVLANKVFAM